MRGAALAAALALLAGGAAAETRLSLPVGCAPGVTCTVQQYVDVDPGPGAADFRCGHLSYDGHEGTDFRPRIGEDVAVLAPADGRVLRVRDGEPDRVFGEENRVPSDRACGNGLVIDHGDLETMLCHLRPGSVAVRPGDTVRRGEVVGVVGSSGWADFSHVELKVTRGGETLDPFTAAAPGALACGATGATLWTEEAAATLLEAPSAFVVAAGFHTGPVTIPMIENGETAAPGGGTIPAGAEALVAYGVVAGIRAGDEQRVVLEGPGVAIDNAVPAERNRAQEMRFAGQRYREGLPAGTYTLRYEVRRAGAVLSAATAVLTVQ
jgi:hypothetical protein